MMKIKSVVRSSFFLIVFNFFQSFLFCQSADLNQYELKGLKDVADLKGVTINSFVQKKGIGNLLLSFYQKVISVQISVDCVYSVSCSRFSRKCVNKYGLFIGILASADRLTRCSTSAAKDIPEYKFDFNELAKEDVD